MRMHVRDEYTRGAKVQLKCEVSRRSNCPMHIIAQGQATMACSQSKAINCHLVSPPHTSPGVAILAISSELGALPHVAWDFREDDLDWRLRGLCHAASLGLKGQRCGLREPWVRDLVVEQVHDLAEGGPEDILAIDGLPHPAGLHARREGLALGITWVPRLGDDLHGHGAGAALARLVAQDPKGPLLELHIVRRARCCSGCREGHVGILRP